MAPSPSGGTEIRGRQDLYPAELQLVRVDRTSRGGEQRDSVPTASERDDQVMDPDAEALIEGTRSIRADHEHASSIGRRHVRCCVQRHIPLNASTTAGTVHE